ncbi:rhamnosyltransferase family domain protein [Burkholderia pseudomallei]|nr:rhamnosyltransferase family domain protein [Burkholderia pseudomallei]
MQLGLQYGLRFPVALVPNLLTIWQVVQVVLCEREKGAKLRGIALGVLDGVFGRLGSFEAARAGHRTAREEAMREARRQS